ncbi:2-phospho-L-lactate guanylyltransferase [Cohaesibacter sp. CAU 1516]|uniref:2-phospho-L-lactate guanylyltransferase n=1 Tax=Cohaesibacter sp. CAU 1516 TaxID=2576038 RepID=UPI0010FE1DE8|nr:2-phospho-L-lactate guanylyltransferase [Cohaesibacter sp. CAU 1516]TLP44322.1 2-phospho-L-lactate guanylyltransferase [Cohaesibacter sp. CAU 1516]
MTTDIARTLLVIPMKDPKDAKTRLGSGLDQRERGDLALSLFGILVQRIQTVLAARAKAQGIANAIDLAVVSASPTLKAAAERLAIRHIPEGPTRGLSAALQHAADEAHALGYGSLCILPGDLADPKPADLSRLIDHAVAGQTAVICPSSDWGTNALLLPLPNPIHFQFGEKSFHNHYRAMADAGLTPILLPLTSLRFDVDRLDDLRHLSRDHWHLLAKGDGR